MKVVWSDRALRRVEGIARYTARDDPDAAVRWTAELFDAIAELGAFPELGRLAPEAASLNVRELTFGLYRAFYRVGSVVEILTVRHGRQLFREDELQ
jgi:plasmid stabilization system protein ParE